MTSTSAYTAGASEIFLMSQIIEGFNFSDMAWGTANAKTVTLSFWAYSSLTGTHSGSIGNGAGYSYPFSFSIPAANTWTQISVTIAGPTTSTWPTNNTANAYLFFNMGCGSARLGTAGAWTATPSYGATGSVSLVGTNGATFYITGVQLEKGSTATPFEQRLYGTELALCQRYYFKISGGSGSRLGIGHNISTIGALVNLSFPVTMRTAPTVTRGGTDTFKPSPAGAATSITLDEPMQVCEIHAVYDTTAGQAWWQVIRRTTEQRRNSYLSAIATTKYCTAEANECFNIAWEAELNRYNIVVDGGDTTIIRFQYAGMYSVNFSATAELPSGANSGDITIGLALNGDEIQYTAYTNHIHKSGEYFTLSHHWLVKITDPTSDQLQVRFFASAIGTCITGGDHLPESDCHEWPAAAINITYAGGGYGIDS